MKYLSLIAFGTIVLGSYSSAQEPVITSWLQNTTNNGTYYVSGNSTALDNGILLNCQAVSYSTDYVYVQATGVPAYPTGPFLDGNPSVAQDQNTIFRFPRNPQQETGSTTTTTPGRIGVFINGVSLFDYRDGVAWNSSANSLCGGPGNPPCPGGPMVTMDWNRDAIPAEMDGFDCSKGHPAMGNYHHHQNPSAFKLDLNVISTICNLYDADGLYAIDANTHSPLIGYAYDGFPIYGAYGFANEDGTGGIERMKSGYELGSYSVRTHNADGTNVADGPNVNATYFLGYFREDYTFVDYPQEDYLDEHNGRWCITPEYPSGTYAYFCTVDENWNSQYPYAVGPTFYGQHSNANVTSINEAVTVYDASNASISEYELTNLAVSIYPNPSADLIAIQIGGLVKENLSVELIDLKGTVVGNHQINAGQTIAYFDVSTLYAGSYFIRIANNEYQITRKVMVK